MRRTASSLPRRMAQNALFHLMRMTITCKSGRLHAAGRELLAMADGGELRTEVALRTVYAMPSKAVRDKALDHIDEHGRSFIALSPFVCIGSSRPDGLADVSPRGGEPGFIHVLDEKRLALPDRPGNNRLDTLTNIVHAPAVGLLFFVPGFEEMLRVNGLAAVTTEEQLMARFIADGKRPRS